MGHRLPDNENRAAIELFPVSGKKAIVAAKAAGLSAFSLPALLVEGDSKPGLGAVTAKAFAEAGINLRFLVAQVLGKKYTSVFGFETEADASKAATSIKRTTAAKQTTVTKSKAVAKKKETPKMQPVRTPKMSVTVSHQSGPPSGTVLQTRPG